MNQWRDTTHKEMEAFLGRIVWMGIVSLPSILPYWSKSFLYTNEVGRVMSRNRFQLLLKTWHFTNNETATISNKDRLFKINLKLRESFQKHILPGEYSCIDESLVPFKGRLKFKHYVTNKRHKFGIKLFKLCLDGGYLFDMKVYCGQENTYTETYTVPAKVVTSLAENLLGKGRTICVDNYYTSIELTHKLAENKTYIIGTQAYLLKNGKTNGMS